MKRLVLRDEFLLLRHFGQDSDWTTHPSWAFLDTELGEIVYVDDLNDDRDDTLARLNANSSRYFKIVPMDHGDHHSILNEFIGSDWTDDAELRQQATIAYGLKSIGAWREAVDSATWNSFESFKEMRIRELLTARLRELGFDPVFE